MIRIPVHYVDRPGFKSDLVSEKSPVVDVVIGDVRTRDKPKLRITKALIDSGADDMFVDEALLIDCGCPVVGKTSVRTLHGTENHPVYRAMMLFESHELAQEVDVIAAKYPAGVRAYEAVFGTRFLELGVLVLDPRGDSHFTIRENAVSQEKSPLQTSERPA